MTDTIQVGDLVLVTRPVGRKSSKVAGRVLALYRDQAKVLLKNHGRPEWIDIGKIKPWKAKNAMRKETQWTK